MATLAVRDANNEIKYLEVDGEGTAENPFRGVQVVRQPVAVEVTEQPLAVALAALPVPVDIATPLAVTVAELPLPVDVMTIPATASEFYVGQSTIATIGQRVQLPAFPLKRGVMLKALSTNSGSIFVGGPGVTATNGYELDKNESILIRIDELSKLWITTTAANEAICVMGV